MTSKISAWLNLDKPQAMSSAQAVARVKHLIGKTSKVGHAGTLDPLASGVLPIAIGEATKTMRFVQDTQKIYEIDICWGSATNTDDSEGEVIARSSVRPARAQIDAALADFIGDIEQVPPQFSAIKKDGVRAYKKARRGEAVALAPRLVRIDDIALLASDEQSARLKISCGKGVYMRALARDLAQKLGTYGHITHLRRLKVGIFDEKCTITLESFAKLCHNANDLAGVQSRLAPLDAVLVDIPALQVESKAAQKLKDGQSIPLKGHKPRLQSHDLYHALQNGRDTNEPFCVYSETGLVALASIQNGYIRALRVFNTSDTRGE